METLDSLIHGLMLADRHLMNSEHILGVQFTKFLLDCLRSDPSQASVEMSGRSSE